MAKPTDMKDSQDNVRVLQNIRDTYAYMAECHEGEPNGDLAASWAAACSAGIAALQAQQGAGPLGFVGANVVAHLKTGGHACTTITAHQAMPDDVAIYATPQKAALAQPQSAQEPSNG